MYTSCFLFISNVFLRKIGKKSNVNKEKYEDDKKIDGIINVN